MPTLTIRYDCDAERRIYEKAIGFAAEMIQLGLVAPDGSVLEACEGLTLTKGRELLRDTLAGAVQARVEHAEKKSRPPADTACATKDGARAR